MKANWLGNCLTDHSNLHFLHNCNQPPGNTHNCSGNVHFSLRMGITSRAADQSLGLCDWALVDLILHHCDCHTSKIIHVTWLVVSVFKTSVFAILTYITQWHLISNHFNRRSFFCLHCLKSLNLIGFLWSLVTMSLVIAFYMDVYVSSYAI